LQFCYSYLNIIKGWKAQNKKVEKIQSELNAKLFENEAEWTADVIDVHDIFTCDDCFALDTCCMLWSYEEHEFTDWMKGLATSFFGLVPHNENMHHMRDSKVMRSLNTAVEGGRIPLSNLMFFQAINRIISSELSILGYKYRDLDKLLGSASTLARKRDMDTSWETFMVQYDFRSDQFMHRFLADDPMLDVVEEHERFVKLLKEEYGITFNEWIEYLFIAFETDGLYIPFNTPAEIIECARSVLAGSHTRLSLYEIYIPSRPLFLSRHIGKV